MGAGIASFFLNFGIMRSFIEGVGFIGPLGGRLPGYFGWRGGRLSFKNMKKDGSIRMIRWFFIIYAADVQSFSIIDKWSLG